MLEKISTTQRRTYNRQNYQQIPEQTDEESGEDTETTIMKNRDKARMLTEEIVEYYQTSKAAYRSGNHSKAKRFSRLAKIYQNERDSRDRTAADAKFRSLNNGKPQTQIDLHGLFVKEAIEKLEERVEFARRIGLKSLTVIAGQGKHSNSQPKLKPAVIEFAQMNGIRCIPNIPNPGCVRFIFE